MNKLNDIQRPTVDLHGEVPVVKLTREGINDLLRENNITYVRIQLNALFNEAVKEVRGDIDRNISYAKGLVLDYGEMKCGKRFDWEKFAEMADKDESLLIQLFDNHVHSEQVAMEHGGLETWVAIIDNGWEGLVPMIGDDYAED